MVAPRAPNHINYSSIKLLKDERLSNYSICLKFYYNKYFDDNEERAFIVHVKRYKDIKCESLIKK